MKDRLLHDHKVLAVSRIQVETVKDIYSGIDVNTSYFDFYNDVCPRCQTQLKVYNNSIKGLGTASIFVVPESNLAFLYACCNKCSREIAKESRYGQRAVIDSKKAEQVESYIRSKLGV